MAEWGGWRAAGPVAWIFGSTVKDRPFGAATHLPPALPPEQA